MISLPHFLTLLRIILIPLFPLIYIEHELFSIPNTYVPIILIVLLVICELSDVLDGFLARKKNQVTDFGKVLDPIADTMMHISVLLTFTQPPVSLPLLLVLVFLYREFLVSALRILCALKGIVLAAKRSGKIKAIMQATISFFILIMMSLYYFDALSLKWLQNMSLIFASITAVYTVISAFDYLYENRSYIKKSFRA